jgi:hypothetical protein
MLLEAIDRPFRFHFADGSEVRLAPGTPMQLDEARARRLMEKVPGKVKVVMSVSPGALITWQVADGSQRGPARIDFLHTDSDGLIWAFYTVPDGNWGAVNMRYATPLQDRSETRQGDR